MGTERNRESNLDPNDTFKILIATDIHLGYEHTKKQKVDDSFVTFEEILKYGQEEEVDFVLLGGDLFHETKPSQTAVIKCVDLLRKYCLGSREINIEFLSNPEEIFNHCATKTVNYEDPNLNVSMPVFTIHGNHDDPSFAAVGSIDLLASTGLVNYFGKWPSVSKITIPPLVIKKGRSHIALYGVSYINDQRLSRMIRDCKFDLLRPEDLEDCFNIFVLHQNRAKHTEHAYIPEHKLPDFLNFVIWGHEHECRIVPEFIAEAGYYICQPGSSIATSLCEGEAVPKNVGILSVNRSKFKLKQLPLRTVRPLVFDNLYLSEQVIKKELGRSLSETICNFVDEYIESVMMPEAVNQLTGHPEQPQLPQLRLRIFHTTDEELFDVMRLSQKYCDVVANPMGMIMWRKDKGPTERRKLNKTGLNDAVDDLAEIYENDTDNELHADLKDIAKKLFNENSTKLSVLSANGLTEALSRFVDGGDTDAFQDIMSHQMKETMLHLEKTSADTTDALRGEISIFRDNRIGKELEERSQIRNFLDDSNRRRLDRSEILSKSNSSMTSKSTTSVDPEITGATTRGRKPRGTSTRGRGRGRGRASGGADSVSLNVSEVPSTRTTRNPVQRGRKKQDQSSMHSFIDMGSQKKTIDGGYIDEDSD